MQPMTAKYVARSIQNDRLAAADRDRLLRGQAGHPIPCTRVSAVPWPTSSASWSPGSPPRPRAERSSSAAAPPEAFEIADHEVPPVLPDEAGTLQLR